MAGKQFNLKIVFDVVNKATGPLNRAGRAFRRLGRQVRRSSKHLAAFGTMAKTVGAKMKQVGANIASRMGLAMAAFGALTARTKLQFETAMNRVEAITGATGKAMMGLREQAKELGITTQFSASQAADAMTFLGMAGLKTEQIMKTMPGTLQLAAAGNMDLATTADIVTNVMTSMGKTSEDLGKINDILAKTATSANTNIMQLAEAFRPVAGFAESAGISIEQLSAMLGKMADSGERGSIAGTLLRNAFANVLKNGRNMQSLFDDLGASQEEFVTEQGKLKNFDVLMNKIAKAGIPPAKIMKAFGERGGRAVLLLTKAGKDLGKFTKELEESDGTAKKMADTMMKGLPGAAKRAKSAFEGLQLALTKGEVGVAMERSLNRLTEAFSTMAEELNTTDFGPFLEIMGTILDVIGTLIAGSMKFIKIMLIDYPAAIARFFGMDKDSKKAKEIAKGGGFKGSAFDVSGQNPFAVKQAISKQKEELKSETSVNIKVTTDEGVDANVVGSPRKKGNPKLRLKFDKGPVWLGGTP
jgi:TP901 family phage tail tape measure protein